jgi:hypothetical protein
MTSQGKSATTITAKYHSNKSSQGKRGSGLFEEKSTMRQPEGGDIGDVWIFYPCLGLRGILTEKEVAIEVTKTYLKILLI